MFFQNFFLTALLGLSVSAVFADANEDLIIAAGSGQLEQVLALIDAGADINAKNDNGDTALKSASRSGRSDIAALLLNHGALVRGVLNDSGVRIRDRATTGVSSVIGSVDRGDQVLILAKSRDVEKIEDMVACWYRIKTESGIVGYSYGYFFDVDEWEVAAAPTFYEDYRYGFVLDFPPTWKEWIAVEELINFGFGVKAPVVYFGLPAQSSIFAVSVFTTEQWNKLSKVEPPDGIEGDPVAENNLFRFKYSLGHYAANDEMHQRRGEVTELMKTIGVFDVERK